MTTSKVKLLVCADAVVETGFSRVMHEIIEHLPANKYEIKWLGVNYYGDPHKYPYEIYPAGLMGDIYGYKRIEMFVKWKPDIIFILNDAWIINKYLEAIAEAFKEQLPKIVTYVPVDAEDHSPSWYSHFNIVSKVISYTKFGRGVIRKALPILDPIVIPHGINREDFFKLPGKKEEIKKAVYPKGRDDLYDSFIVLNANRNQPRKRLDLTIKGFAIFASGKPENVKLYLHCGITDSHIDIVEYAGRYGLSNRLLLSNLNHGVQQVTREQLNFTYNATDVGINTGLGEGWGLTQIEHAITGAPQVVGNHSALKELYSDCGLLINTEATWTIDRIMTTSYLVSPESLAENLEKLYTDKKLFEDLSTKSIQKFSSSTYDWKNISSRFDKIFDEVLE